MSVKQWHASMPANLALIKYMGKSDVSQNLPANPSLSITLEQFRTTVELRLSEHSQDSWLALPVSDAIYPIQLSSTGQTKFLAHLARIKSHFGFTGHFKVHSGNNFLADCGLASSASSFAALTLCAAKACAQLTETPMPSLSELAGMSQRGSGSSCRSFFGPWVLWDGAEVSPCDLPFANLQHDLVAVSAEAKAVSSSKAHQLVPSSLLYQGRPSRATQRLQALTTALEAGAWRTCHDLIWAEFQDMHALFSTSMPGFSYINTESQQVLDYCQAYWQRYQDGPWVTMDAGPNVHLLFRAEAKSLRTDFLRPLQARFAVHTGITEHAGS